MNIVGKIVAGIGLLLLVGVGAFLVPHPNSDVIVRVVGDQCEASLVESQDLEACLKGERDLGYLIIKGRKGSHHFLLLPTVPLVGIESAHLLDPLTPNYVWQAWENRHYLTTSKAGLSDDDVMLAVSSRYGRTHDQLHVDIACISAEAKRGLEVFDEGATGWIPLAENLQSRTYWARKVGAKELQERGPFRILAESFPEPSQAMANYSLALTKSRDGSFLLITTRVSFLDLNLAAAGELQDHDCKSASLATNHYTTIHTSPSAVTAMFTGG